MNILVLIRSMLLSLAVCTADDQASNLTQGGTTIAPTHLLRGGSASVEGAHKACIV